MAARQQNNCTNNSCLLRRTHKIQISWTGGVFKNKAYCCCSGREENRGSQGDATQTRSRSSQTGHSDNQGRSNRQGLCGCHCTHKGIRDRTTRWKTGALSPTCGIIVFDINYYNRLSNMDLGEITQQDIIRLRDLNYTTLTDSEYTELTVLSRGLMRKGRLSKARIYSKWSSHDTTTFKQIPTVQDKYLCELFKCTNQELSIRRLRLSSLLKTDPELTKMCGWFTHLPYALVTNLTIYATLWGIEHVMEMKGHGWFNTVDDFLRITSEVNAYVKGFAKEATLKQQFCELQSLHGHMFESSNWNLLDEAKELTSPGNHTHFHTRQHWLKTIEENTPDREHPPTKVSFEEYVKEAMWITSGSASIGRIDWSWDGDKGHFKARKNMLTCLYTPDELWQIALNWDGHIRNRQIIKNECGKMRLAIASNIESYLHESYLLDQYGHSYTRWSFMTLDEPVSRATKRNIEIMESLSQGLIGMPWDFKGFDRQPTTQELEDMLHALFHNMFGDKDIFDVYNKVIHSYYHAELTVTEKAKTYKFKVNGGVQSGQRFTSLLGNLWNRYKTIQAIDLASGLLGYKPVYNIGLRGDDTYVLSTTYSEAIALRLGYAGVHAIGHNKKFSIRPYSVEFLRNEINPTEVVGWSARTIPSITQRKPWSDTPFDPMQEVTIIASGINTTMRRSKCSGRTLHDANMRQWSQFLKLSNRWLKLPRHLGGVGVYPWEGWVPDCGLPPTTHPDFRVDTKVVAHNPPYLDGIVEPTTYSLQKLKTMISPGDIVGMSGKAARLARLHYSKVKPKWSRVSTHHRYLDLPDLTISEHKIYRQPRKGAYLRATQTGWPEAMRFISDYGFYRAPGSRSLGSMLREYYPLFYAKMKQYERQGWHRTDAIKLVTGDVPFEYSHTINPNAIGHLKIPVKENLPLLGYGRKIIGMRLTALCSQVITAYRHSSTSRLYQY
ncbi:RNA-dependent RNA polymerase [Soybean thrips-associated totivirus 2]|uniref:RNA-directed RNA polymerase n=1 Tax=Soybean thrips-associated totivirus 2 TaxID=2800857 RepID=A0A7U3TJP8_9VIRU|nr:RNA-dependent RNA polymerase [Soybean thrips-associated totivirus 2]